MNFKEVTTNLTEEGFLRKVDELGRIVIPVKFRGKSFKEGDIVFGYTYKDYIILTDSNLQNSGVKQKIDELGRITLYKNIRDLFEIKERDSMSVWSYNNFIIMKKFENKCVFCKSDNKLMEFKEKLICFNCKKEIGEDI